MALLVSDLSDKSDKSDKNALKQEVAANTMICLINQETYLLARQIARLAAFLRFKDCISFEQSYIMT